MSKKMMAVIAALVVSGLAFWVYLKTEPDPLGYNGTAEHLRNIPGERPTIDMLVVNEYIKKFQLTIDGREVTPESGEFTLPRNKEVTVKGRVEFDLGTDGFIGMFMGVGTKSSNVQGVLIEGDLRLHDGLSLSPGRPLVIPVDRKWQVPDRAGEFSLLVYYFIEEKGDPNTRAKFAIVCPVRIE